MFRVAPVLLINGDDSDCQSQGALLVLSFAATRSVAPSLAAHNFNLKLLDSAVHSESLAPLRMVMLLVEQLESLRLFRCGGITDISITGLALYCHRLVELDLATLGRVTDASIMVSATGTGSGLAVRVTFTCNVNCQWQLERHVEVTPSFTCVVLI